MPAISHVRPPGALAPLSLYIQGLANTPTMPGTSSQDPRAAAEGAPTSASLPDELWVEVLSRLPLQER